VDGHLDYRYVQMYNPGSHHRNYFVSYDGREKYHFKFSPTVWTKDLGCVLGICGNAIGTCGNTCVYADDYNKRYGGPGAISVYFYRARRIQDSIDFPIRERNGVTEDNNGEDSEELEEGEWSYDEVRFEQQILPKFELNQNILVENKLVTNSIWISTKFECEKFPNGVVMPNANILEAIDTFPVAALHLHYRLATNKLPKMIEQYTNRNAGKDVENEWIFDDFFDRQGPTKELTNPLIKQEFSGEGFYVSLMNPDPINNYMNLSTNFEDVEDVKDKQESKVKTSFEQQFEFNKDKVLQEEMNPKLLCKGDTKTRSVDELNRKEGFYAISFNGIDEIKMDEKFHHKENLTPGILNNTIKTYAGEPMLPRFDITSHSRDFES
ncbi:2256_t:CDS:2, partial [Acaulospora morrowiae]